MNTKANGRPKLPIHHAADSERWEGRAPTDQTLKQIGPQRAVWIRPGRERILSVAHFRRPAADPRPPVGHVDAPVPFSLVG